MKVESDYEKKGAILMWASNCDMAGPPKEVGDISDISFAEEDEEGIESISISGN